MKQGGIFINFLSVLNFNIIAMCPKFEYYTYLELIKYNELDKYTVAKYKPSKQELVDLTK